MSKMNQSDLKEILGSANTDNEMAVEITFASEDAAKNFANLANQVAFDTTLDLQHGDQDITESLRNYAQNHLELNIEATRERVNAQLPGDLIQQLEERGDGLDIKSINRKDSTSEPRRIILETK